MARPRKDNHPVTIRLATPLYDQLNRFCEDAGQTKTTAMERALVMYMDEYYKDQKIIAENKKD